MQLYGIYMNACTHTNTHTHGLGICANYDVAVVFIFDNTNSKTFDTMINLHILLHYENTFNDYFEMLLSYYNPLGHSYDCF